MYNRYVPQADGSYRRNRMDSPRQQHQSIQPSPCPPEPTECLQKQSIHHPQRVGTFLKQLLPAGFDTADLIIMLLLLLLAGDCEEDKTTAMLTMVLYLFM